MAIALNWPSSIGAPEFPLTETFEDAVIRSTMEDGTIKTRPIFTRNRFTYELTWSYWPDDKTRYLASFLLF